MVSEIEDGAISRPLVTLREVDVGLAFLVVSSFLLVLVARAGDVNPP